jgi:hypothetical protein
MLMTLPFLGLLSVQTTGHASKVTASPLSLSVLVILFNDEIDLCWTQLPILIEGSLEPCPVCEVDADS